MFLDILIVLVLVALNGFFVAAEFALVKVRLSEVEVLSQEGSTTAQITEGILRRLDVYLSACQLGITLASLGLGWVGEPLVATMLESIVRGYGLSEESLHYISLVVAFGLITFLHITAGEQVPKILAIQKYQPTALAISVPLALFFKVFQPFIWFLNVSSNAMLRLVGVTLTSEHEQTPTETELRLTLISAAAGGHVTRRERLIMENVLDLENKTARRYMLPRHQIVYLNQQDSMDEKLRLATESGHTRFPLCDEDLDHIIGVVHVKDVFKAMHEQDTLTSLAGVARDPFYLPETIKLDVLLLEFQKKNAIMAFLVDEYGTVSGMITLENVIEELIGPIQDEFDSEPPPLLRRGVNRFELDASCPIDLAVKRCQLELPSDITSDTIAGVMIELLGHIPEKGEQVRQGHHVMKVLEAEPTRIKRISIERKEPEEIEEAEGEEGD